MKTNRLLALLSGGVFLAVVMSLYHMLELMQRAEVNHDRMPSERLKAEVSSRICFSFWPRNVIRRIPKRSIKYTEWIFWLCHWWFKSKCLSAGVEPSPTGDWKAGATPHWKQSCGCKAPRLSAPTQSRSRSLCELRFCPQPRWPTAWMSSGSGDERRRRRSPG